MIIPVCVPYSTLTHEDELLHGAVWESIGDVGRAIVGFVIDSCPGILVQLLKDGGAIFHTGSISCFDFRFDAFECLFYGSNGPVRIDYSDPKLFDTIEDFINCFNVHN